MRTFLLLAAILVATGPAVASARGIDLRPPARPPEDPGSATTLLYQKPDPARVPDRGPASASDCTDETGTIYRAGAAGFAACLRTRNLTRPERPLPGNRGDSLLLFGK